jgi:hypothetical protein
MKLFGRRAFSGQGGVDTIQTRAAELESRLAAVVGTPSFISGYVAPDADIEQVARSVRARFPDVALTLTTTAGELCSGGGRSLYCDATEGRDRVVLQCFDRSVIGEARVVAIPLSSEDLRKSGQVMDYRERIDRLVRSIQATQVSHSFAIRVNNHAVR